MSGSLHWEPALSNAEPVTKAGSIIRDILSARYGMPARLDAGDIDYLRGIRDTGLDGAAELIALIERHGAIVVSIIY